MAVTAQVYQTIPIGTTRKNVIVLLVDTGQYRKYTFTLIPLATDPLSGADLNALWAAASAITAADYATHQQVGLRSYYKAIIASIYNDVDNVNVTMTTLLNNAATIVATNSTQAAKFNAYRTRLGLGGAIGGMTATQQGQLLVLAIEWAAAGLAVANNQ